jgi:phosphomannomutase
LLDRLDEIEGRYGVHAGAQLSFRRDGAQGLKDIARKIAELCDQPPALLGGVAVRSVIDLAHGYRGLPPTPGLLWDLGERGRVIVRPSGTEPKIKAYIEVIVVRERARDLRDERAIATELLARVSDDVVALLSR